MPEALPSASSCDGRKCLWTLPHVLCEAVSLGENHCSRYPAVTVPQMLSFVGRFRDDKFPWCSFSSARVLGASGQCCLRAGGVSPGALEAREAGGAAALLSCLFSTEDAMAWRKL